MCLNVCEHVSVLMCVFECVCVCVYPSDQLIIVLMHV